MNLHKLIFTNNDCYKEGRTITVKGIMVHSTGANNPNLRRYVAPDDGKLGANTNDNDWNRSGTGACVHGFIGKLKDGIIATYQVLPWNHRGWHCASGSKGSGNDGYISFEICEDGLADGTYFGKVYKEAVELCAYLCKSYNLNPQADGVVICHSEGCSRGIASNHADIMHWFPKHGKSMDAFRADVKATVSGTASSTVTAPPVSSTELYRVRKSWSDAGSQIGAFGNMENAKAACKDGYTVYNNGGAAVYTKAITSSNITVQVSIADLQIRTGAGKKFASVGCCPKGIYTITEQKTADGYTWGRLKSGTGWIALEYTTKV